MTTTLRYPDSTIGPFRENDSIVLRGVLQDNSDPPQAIPGTALVSARLTLYTEYGDQGIIAGIDDADVLSHIDAAGNLSYPISSAAMAILDDTLATEYHRALLEWVWNTDQRGSWEVRIIVKNLYRVP